MGKKQVAMALVATLLVLTYSAVSAQQQEIVVTRIPTSEPIDIFTTVDRPEDLSDAIAAALDRRPVIQERFVQNSGDFERAFNDTVAMPYEVSIRFMDGAVFAIVVEAIEPVREGVKRIRGYVRSDDLSRLSLVIADSHVLGTLQTESRTLEFIQVGERISVVVDLDHRRYPPERRPGDAHKRPEFDTFPHPEPPEVVPTGGVIDGPEPFDGVPISDKDYDAPEITVLLIMSEDESDCDPDYVKNQGDAYTLNLNDVFEGYAMSRVTFRCVDVNEDWNDIVEAQNWLVTSTEVKGWRQEAEADLVVMLLADGLGSCGYSEGPNYPNYPIDAVYTPYFAEFGAFAVVAEKCALGNLSFAHEIGHLLGMKHERFSERGGVSNFCGYGYPIMSGCKPVARTIMAYDGFCTFVNGVTCKRAPTLSIPRNSSGSSFAAFSGSGQVKGMSCESTESDHLGAAANNTYQLKDTADEVASYWPLIAAQ